MECLKITFIISASLTSWANAGNELDQTASGTASPYTDLSEVFDKQFPSEDSTPDPKAKDYVVTQVTPPVDYGEGPHWDDKNGVLYYVSVTDKTVHRYDPTSGSHLSVKLPKPVSLVIPVRGSTNKFIVTQDREVAMLTWDWNTGVTDLCTITSVESDKPGNRFNAGKADARGRLWAGTVENECLEPFPLPDNEKGALYRIGKEHDSWKASNEVNRTSVSNGMVWSADNSLLYWTDMPLKMIFIFDYNIETGTITKNGKIAYWMGQYDGHYVGGMTIDTDGNLWVASFGHSQVMQVDPKSHLVLRWVNMPTEKVTSVTWGGANLDELYVTTMRHGMSRYQLQSEPHAGAVFKITGLGAKGLPANEAAINVKCNSSNGGAAKRRSWHENQDGQN